MKQKTGLCSQKAGSKRVAAPCRWAQRLAGLDFIPPPEQATPLPTGSAAAAAGHVLAGLAEYRQQQRAEKALEQLRLAARPAEK